MKPSEIRFTPETVKDIKKMTPRLREKLRVIALERVAAEPKSGKRLMGDLEGFCSLPMTRKNRIVYLIDEENRVVFIHRARTHNGE